jgi:hypothetical protein
MAEAFLELSKEDRKQVLDVAASKAGRPPHLLEKDVWVVWSLAALFESELGCQLVFKGGTSLSKAYQAIRRFSEDVDLTQDIRVLAADLVGDARDLLPDTVSQGRRWTSLIRKRLPVWVAETVLPVITARLSTSGAPAIARVEEDKIFIAYEPLAQGSRYTRPEVVLEFGARSTGEPCATRPIVCDAAEWIPGVNFPTAQPRVMLAERTFWEKATAIHVYCIGGRIRGDRFVRHWHDIARMDEAGLVAAALSNRELAQAVADHKSIFFVEKTVDGKKIDYHAAVTGSLTLLPGSTGLPALAEDYDQMIDDGLLLDEAESFEDLMEHCHSIEVRANS